MKNLRYSKIWIGDDPKLSEKVQKRLFELGYHWGSNNQKLNTDVKSIFLYEDYSLAQTSDKLYFDTQCSRYKEIFLSDLFDKEWIPKANDWAVLITEYSSLEVGKAYRLLRRQSYVGHVGEECWVVDHKGGSSFMAPYLSYLRKALPNEIPVDMETTGLVQNENEFQVGDTVIGLPSANSEYSYTKEGSIGEVFVVNENTIRVKFSNVPEVCGTVTVSKKHFKVLNKSNNNLNKQKSGKQSEKTGNTIEVCRPTSKIVRGKVYRGQTVSCRTKETSIRLGHLSNKAITG